MAYHLLQSLQHRGIQSILLDINDSLPTLETWWFGTEEEVNRLGGRGIPVSLETVDSAVGRMMMAMHNIDSVEHLIIGIDPGPRPGCAWLSDGYLLGKAQVESVHDVLDLVASLVKEFSPNDVLIRVGNGSPLHRDQLINGAISHHFRVQEVNEHRTSSGSSRHEHTSAALKIARLKGSEVNEVRPILPTDGDLRNLQRLSRRRSGGRLTISLDQARRIACGYCTMEEALESSGYSSSTSASVFFEV